ncbi:hypothetical protein HanIR_Chr02g0095111 [Helianthus annuus]|nr:hypothetical protein HanIR_Chr02g0095111 [Helianthus annuus]
MYMYSIFLLGKAVIFKSLYLLGMAKKPKPDGYTRNPKHTGRVYPKPDGYGIKNIKIFGYGYGI